MHDHGYWALLRDAASAERAGVSRREFLTLIGASAALAGAGACTRAPDEKIVPYTVRPRVDAGGRPLTYATTFVREGYGVGLLVESHAGRPTKIEGNPDHPASLGATGPIEQATVLQLYDPARATTPRIGSAPATWQAVASELAAPRPDRGRGLRIVMERTSSPLLAELLRRVLERAPEARVVPWLPAAGGAAEGARRLYGRPLSTVYQLGGAGVVVAVDSDFLTTGPFALRYAHDYAARRRLRGPDFPRTRLYAVESPLTPTGTMADHRLALPPRAVARWTGALAAELVLGRGLRPAGMPAGLETVLAPLRDGAGPNGDWMRAAAADLAGSRGASVVIVGDEQPAAVHVMGELANLALGNVGATVLGYDPALASLGAGEQDLAGLAADVRSGAVDTLVVLESDLAHSWAGGIDWRELIPRVPRSYYLGLYEDETSALCKSAVPAAHYLEAWGDARAVDGTVSVVQPLIAPMHGGRTPSEVLAALAGEVGVAPHDLLTRSWRQRHGARGFDELWHATLRSGVVPGSAGRPVTSLLDWRAVVAAAGELAAERAGGLEVSLRLDSRVYDGRFANDAWLLELPDPITHQSWGNAALLGPETARSLGVEDGRHLELEANGRRVQAPALVTRGHAEGAVTCHLGWGHAGAAGLGRGVGFNASPLGGPGRPGAPVTVRRLDTSEVLVVLQPFRETFGRPIALAATVDEFRRTPRLAQFTKPPDASLYGLEPKAGEQWAMTIDMSLCTGCSACVIACQAENNIPVVGKEQVYRYRWMHWLRIDEYWTEVRGHPVVVRQPMLCQHCEMAPCEYVCPVNATVHSADGLNEMIYNRCVGTRYCSNNCPYKVRRFNFFDWYEHIGLNRGPVELQRNPDVTVRARGVMEKCTYCVQRIREKGIQATLEGRLLADGEVKTACQQACPTGAIVFGSLTQPGSAVSRTRELPCAYGELADQGTQPRTRYVVKITNPNPEVT